MDPNHLNAEFAIIVRSGLEGRGLDVLAPADSDSVENVKSVSGTFLRRITLPVAAQAEAITARYAHGVLEIDIPKQARVETKRIPITVH